MVCLLEIVIAHDWYNSTACCCAWISGCQKLSLSCGLRSQWHTHSCYGYNTSVIFSAIVVSCLDGVFKSWSEWVVDSPSWWFLGLVSTQKTGPTLVFLFSPSNKNCGKAFAVPSKKNLLCYILDTSQCAVLWSWQIRSRTVGMSWDWMLKLLLTWWKLLDLCFNYFLAFWNNLLVYLSLVEARGCILW